MKREYINHILNAKSIGQAAVEEFINVRLHERSVSFWNPVKKMNLYTFQSGNKTLKVTNKSETTLILKEHQLLYSRLLTVSAVRQLDLKEVLSHELSTIPLSLFHATGEMRKTNKSQLLKEIKETSVNYQYLSEITPMNSVSLIDFMALVQTLRSTRFETFGEIAKSLALSILSNFQESNIVAVIPDRYDIKDSIKFDERSRREKSDSVVIDITADLQKLPKCMTDFLTNSTNKHHLIKYLFLKWRYSFNKKLSDNQVIYLADIDGSTIKVTQHGSTVLEFKSDHEEADTKMFAYGKYIVTEHPIRKMIISSPDTDVAVISCFQKSSHLESIDEMWLKSGVGDNKEYLPIHDIIDQLGFSVVQLLPAVHSITGCDSVSSLFGVGKKNAFETLKENSENLSEMRLFGDSPTLSIADDHVTACIKFVCSLYDKSREEYNINYLRYKLFTQKSLTGEKLPPTLNSLVFHLQRANYQCYAWKKACNPLLNLPGPVGNGWVKNGEVLNQEKTVRNAVPENIVELIRCKCKKGCKTNACGCRKEGLKCTDACLCNNTQECENQNEHYCESSDDED